MADLGDGTILIGHSLGGTILINALAEAPPERKLAGVFLVAAPFVGAGGWSSDHIMPTADLGARRPPKTPIYLYHGSIFACSTPQDTPSWPKAPPTTIAPFAQESVSRVSAQQASPSQAD